MTTPAGYRALADLLRAQIQSGELMAGQRLPSEPALAQTYGLNLLTVRRALAVLRNEGLIDVRGGYRSRVRELPDVRDIDPPPGTVAITSRVATAVEREAHDIPDGVPLLVAIDADGNTHEFPAHRYRFRWPSG